MQLVPRQVSGHRHQLGANPNCRAAILAANEKETAAKIAALQLAAADTAASPGINAAAFPIARKEMNIRPPAV